MEELYKQVQKELHTRFKNMFEGEMLLPNLEFNPGFDGNVDTDLLHLKEDEILDEEEHVTEQKYLALMQREQDGNWLHSHS